MPTNVTGKTDTGVCLNFLGQLYQVGQKETPFLTMIGGLAGGGKTTTSFIFPVSQEWGLNAATQPAISEDDSVTAPDPTTFVRAQKYNTCQIFQRAVTVTYAKQSQIGALSGINIEGTNPVRDEKSFQIEANLKQVAKDVEHTFLNGTFQEAAASNEAYKTRGMLEAITTNVVDAGNSALTIEYIKDLVRSMADNGAPFDRPVLFAGSAKIQQISTLYKADDKFTSHERNYGGFSVKTVLTDFVELGIVWAPAMPANAIMIADLSYIAPVFCPVPNKGVLFYEDLGKKGAAEVGQIYGQIGLDYGLEAAHGKITNLT